MKLKVLSILTLGLILSACGEEEPLKIEPQVYAQLIKTGEAEAIVKLIDRAKQNPCQPIYLFNNLDSENKQEVNLINVECESLNLPKAQNTEEQDIKTP